MLAGWVDGWMGCWIGGWMDEWMSGSVGGWVGGAWIDPGFMPPYNCTLVQALSLCAGSTMVLSAKCGLLRFTVLGWVLHVGPVRESRGRGTRLWSVLSTSPRV